MSKGYYNADNLWVAAYEQHMEEEHLNLLIAFVLNGVELSNIHREFLIERGYDPETGLSYD